MLLCSPPVFSVRPPPTPFFSAEEHYILVLPPGDRFQKKQKNEVTWFPPQRSCVPHGLLRVAKKARVRRFTHICTYKTWCRIGVDSFFCFIMPTTTGDATQTQVKSQTQILSIPMVMVCLPPVCYHEKKNLPAGGGKEQQLNVRRGNP